MTKVLILLVAGLGLATGVLAHEKPVLQFLVGSDLMSVEIEQIEQVQKSEDLNGSPAVLVQFDRQVADAFGQFTRHHQGQVMTVFLCEDVISEPVIQSAIFGGVVMISGQKPRQRDKLFDQLSGARGCH